MPQKRAATNADVIQAGVNRVGNIGRIRGKVQYFGDHAEAQDDNGDTGVNMILRNLKYMLSEEGVEEVEAGEGVKFNPYEHQAMMTEEKDGLDNDVIVQVFQKGYKLKGKIIRPAMVTVNKKQFLTL